jgi:hypothetical protein
MESWSFPSSLNEAKDASLNIPYQPHYAELRRFAELNAANLR